MIKNFSIIVLVAVLFALNACNQTNNKQNNQTEKPEKTQDYLSVDDLFTQGESLFVKNLYVEGLMALLNTCVNIHGKDVKLSESAF